MKMHISYTLTHTYGHWRISTHTTKHTSRYIYANTNKYVSPPTHISAHLHSCTHTRAHKHIHTHTHTHTHTCTNAQALTYTCARALTRTRAYKIKMHTQKIRSYPHEYTHLLTHAHEHTSAHRIYRPAQKHSYTNALTFTCAGAHP